MSEWPVKDFPGFVAFHYDSRESGLGVGRPEDEAYFEFEQIFKYMRAILVHPGNYFGIIDQFDETLQFIVNPDSTVKLDYIVEGEKGSLVKTVQLDEAIELIKKAEPSLAELEIQGTVFEKW